MIAVFMCDGQLAAAAFNKIIAADDMMVMLYTGKDCPVSRFPTTTLCTQRVLWIG
jgi:hypothetical protein